MELKADHLMTAEVLYSLGCVHLSEHRLHVRTNNIQLLSLHRCVLLN